MFLVLAKRSFADCVYESYRVCAVVFDEAELMLALGPTFPEIPQYFLKPDRLTRGQKIPRNRHLSLASEKTEPGPLS